MADKLAMSYNPLILPSTGHAGDLGGAQTPGGGPRRSSHLDLPRDLVLERSRLNLLGDPPVPWVPGGCHASTCPGIRSLGGCHASACLGICTLTRRCMALRLRQYWVEQASESLLVFFFSFSSLLLLTWLYFRWEITNPLPGRHP